jgi:V-type H+-transporting ATPase subunit H
VRLVTFQPFSPSNLSQEDHSRVEIFLDYASKRKENVWGPFLSLLNRSDGFIINMSSRILAKLACWGQEQMPKSDLHFYLQWLKDQLTVNVSHFAVYIFY